MDIYRIKILTYLIWILTVRSTVIAKDPLQCYQCKNYDKFFTDPIQSHADCSDPSNYVITTCDASSNFCLKAMGSISGAGRPNLVASPEASFSAATGNSAATGDVILRGCVGPEALLVFNPDGNSYRAEGGCQSGRREVPVPDEAYYNSNSTPAYLFSGTYCLCRNDRCNGATSFMSDSNRKTIFTVTVTSLMATLTYWL